MSHGLLRALHLLGLVLWFGSQLVVSRLLREHARAPEEARSTLLVFARRTQLGFGLPGLVLTWGGGAWMFLSAPKAYMSWGAIHAMLLGAVVATGVEIALAIALKKARVQPHAGPLPLVLHALSGLVLVGVVLASGLIGR